MAILRKDSSQPHDYVVAMRNSESLSRTLWGVLQYDSEPRALVHEDREQEEQPPYQQPGQGTTYGAFDPE
jgi:hypothetical protein